MHTGLMLSIQRGTFIGISPRHLDVPSTCSPLQPSDTTEEMFVSVAAHTSGMTNVLPTILIDASMPDSWQLGSSALSLSAVLCINMTHISPWAATQGLMKGAGEQRKDALHDGMVLRSLSWHCHCNCYVRRLRAPPLPPNPNPAHTSCALRHTPSIGRPAAAAHIVSLQGRSRDLRGLSHSYHQQLRQGRM